MSRFSFGAISVMTRTVRTKFTGFVGTKFFGDGPKTNFGQFPKLAGKGIDTYIRVCYIDGATGHETKI